MTVSEIKRQLLEAVVDVDVNKDYVSVPAWMILRLLIELGKEN